MIIIISLFIIIYITCFFHDHENHWHRGVQRSAAAGDGSDAARGLGDLGDLGIKNDRKSMEKPSGFHGVFHGFSY